MIPIESIRYQHQLDNLFRKMSELSDEPELQSHWAKYLCVLVSGYIEVSVQAIYREYARKASAPNVANYVESQLKYFQNPNMEKILSLVRQFKGEWAEALDQATKDEIKDKVDSIVANRHLIVHGRSVGITYHRIKEYYQSAMNVVRLINDISNGSS